MDNKIYKDDKGHFQINIQLKIFKEIIKKIK